MSGFQNVRAIALTAAAANIAQARFVKMTATGASLAGAGEDAVGMALESYVHADFTAGGASNVIAVAQLDGAKLMIEAGGEVAAGDPIASDATGRAVTAGFEEFVLGYATEAAGAAGVIFQIVSSKAGLSAADPG